MLPEVLCLRLRRGYSLSSFPPTTRPSRRSLPSSRSCVARAKTRRPTRGITDSHNPSRGDLVMPTSETARKQQSRVTGQQQLSYGEAKTQIKSSGNVATLPTVCRPRVRKAAHDKEPQEANACAKVPKVWPSGRCASGGGRVDQVMSSPCLGHVAWAGARRSRGSLERQSADSGVCGGWLIVSFRDIVLPDPKCSYLSDIQLLTAVTRPAPKHHRSLLIRHSPHPST
ncbi:hypothetical protein BGZ61DRAFT_160237 [Ilyonectria robusta]|uniref:uncharacterized protein n=1 Tax=Ilyonectria robusta TaxID=1079257 RepID=UPI001E8DA344|nr:uncharacterized protein BGZ61DRAFT_160237 [Ilyonectria robusta]KAH8733468.1 hypothetical protein BGZ61DRAFT_160237 [Ilyonectria robusta]